MVGFTIRLRLASAHPEIGLYCGKIKTLIFAPLHAVICNKQTPTS